MGLTTGTTEDNRASLSLAALAELDSEYGVTRLGRQELDGVLLEDVEGALWKQWMFEVEGFRVARAAVPPLNRPVVAVDPAVTTTDSADLTAFTVADRSYPLEQMYGDRRPRGHVLHAEQDRYTPTAAMRRAALYHEHQADCVVIEANNGGDYLPVLLAEVDPTVPSRPRHPRQARPGGAGGDAVRAVARQPRGLAAHLRGIGGADDDVRRRLGGLGEVPGPVRLLRLGAEGPLPRRFRTGHAVTSLRQPARRSPLISPPSRRIVRGGAVINGDRVIKLLRGSQDFIDFQEP
ncbi:hypothetical protein [Streptomyces sp. S.PB5]|uniref:hypothetical protein n=1 Tax=Streptomyces sp. S.PB5 TaxID=3020844 RepID=UPI0025B04488|nr:hypothetical protein [Streptomyces sp. S.PB5]MDN3027524.1 hypothetical protein [Streptomyces sp. S.PB5]